MTVEEYLDELMNGDVEDPSIESDCEVASQVTAEMSKIVDEVELQWLEPMAKNIALWSEPTSIIAAAIDRIETTIDRLNNLRWRLLGTYFPALS